MRVLRPLGTVAAPAAYDRYYVMELLDDWAISTNPTYLFGAA